MSIGTIKDGLKGFLVDPCRIDEEPSRFSVEEKVKRVGAKCIRRKTAKMWTRKEENVLRRVIIGNRTAKGCPINSPNLEPKEITNDIRRKLQRNDKQLRAKWKNKLCPDCLGPIRAEHKAVIQELSKDHFGKFEKISRAFADMVLDNKPKGKYYSSNKIQNYLQSLRKVKALSVEPTQEKQLEGRSSETTTLESLSVEEWISRDQKEILSENDIKFDFLESWEEFGERLHREALGNRTE